MILEETTQTITKDNKENKNIYYDNNDNINQQLATESASSVAKEKKL